MSRIPLARQDSFDWIRQANGPEERPGGGPCTNFWVPKEGDFTKSYGTWGCKSYARNCYIMVIINPISRDITPIPMQLYIHLQLELRFQVSIWGMMETYPAKYRGKLGIYFNGHLSRSFGVLAQVIAILMVDSDIFDRATRASAATSQGFLYVMPTPQWLYKSFHK